MAHGLAARNLNGLLHAAVCSLDMQVSDLASSPTASGPDNRINQRRVALIRQVHRPSRVFGSRQGPKRTQIAGGIAQSFSEVWNRMADRHMSTPYLEEDANNFDALGSLFPIDSHAIRIVSHPGLLPTVAYLSERDPPNQHH